MYRYVYIPIFYMYGIFTNICHKNHPNVGKYYIHGAYGIYLDNESNLKLQVVQALKNHCRVLKGSTGKTGKLDMWVLIYTNWEVAPKTSKNYVENPEHVCLNFGFL